MDSPSPPFSRSVSRIVGSLILVSVLTFLVTVVGCGGPAGPKDILEGKVTLNNEPITGTLIFVKDGKEEPTQIGPDGSYRVQNLAKGTYEVLVKGMDGIEPILHPPKDANKDPALMAAGGSMPKAPPPKYATTGNGLTVTVTGGAQKHDIPLHP